jgi:hypothetical protein
MRRDSRRRHTSRCAWCPSSLGQDRDRGVVAVEPLVNEHMRLNEGVNWASTLVQAPSPVKRLFQAFLSPAKFSARGVRNTAACHAVAAFRRRGAARRHCPRARQRAAPHPGQRAPRGARYRPGGHRHGSFTQACRPTAGNDHRRHPRRENLRPGSTASTNCATARSSR